MATSLALAAAAVLTALALVLAGLPPARRCRPLARHIGLLARRCRPLARRIRPLIGRPRLIGAVGAGLTAAGLLAAHVALLDAADEPGSLDRPIVAWIAGHRPSSGFTALVIALTDLGGTVLMTGLLAAAAIAVAVRVRSWRPIALALTTGAGGILLIAGVKVLVARTRPDPLHHAVAETGYSFPSGHATGAAFALGTVAWLVAIATARPVVRATAWTAAVLLAGAIALSRVYLGVHYLTDVLAGLALGGAWLATVAAAHLLSPDRPRVRRPLGAAAGLAAIAGVVTLAAVAD